MSKRRGPLKDHEKKFIQDHCLDMTDRAIADAVNRDVRTVKSYRKEIGVEKGRGGKIDKIELFDNTKIKPESDLSKSNKREFYKMQLKNSVYFETLKRQLKEEELQYYLEAWSELSQQFSDLISTEKRQIDEMIKAEIMGNRIFQSVKDTEDELEELAEELESIRGNEQFEQDEELVEKYEFIQGYFQRLAALSQAMANDYQKTVQLRRNIIDDLNGRRKDRAEQIKKVGTTFLSLVEAFREEEVRKNQGEHAELLRIARDKKMKEWRRENVFPDGSKDCILLDDESEVGEKTNYLIEEFIKPDLLKNPTEIDGVENAQKNSDS